MQKRKSSKKRIENKDKPQSCDPTVINERIYYITLGTVAV